MGILLALAGFNLGPGATHVLVPSTRLDEFATAYEFHEVHSILVQAPRARIYQALKEVTAEEIRFFRALTWLRRFGRSSRESILNPSPHLPILDVATRSGFLLLADEPDREMVLGVFVKAPAGAQKSPAPEQFRTLESKGLVKAAMNFLIEDAAPGAQAAGRRTFSRKARDGTLRGRWLSHIPWSPDTIAIMLAQVQYERFQRDLHIQRHVRLVAMFPIHCEPR